MDILLRDLDNNMDVCCFVRISYNKNINIYGLCLPNEIHSYLLEKSTTNLQINNFKYSNNMSYNYNKKFNMEESVNEVNKIKQHIGVIQIQPQINQFNKLPIFPISMNNFYQLGNILQNISTIPSILQKPSLHHIQPIQPIQQPIQPIQPVKQSIQNNMDIIDKEYKSFTTKIKRKYKIEIGIISSNMDNYKRKKLNESFCQIMHKEQNNKEKLFLIN